MNKRIKLSKLFCLFSTISLPAIMSISLAGCSPSWDYSNIDDKYLRMYGLTQIKSYEQNNFSNFYLTPFSTFKINNIDNQQLQEKVLQKVLLAKSEYKTKISKDLSIVYGNTPPINPHDSCISITINANDEAIKNIPSNEAYTMNINNLNVDLVAKNDLGVLYGLRTLLCIMIVNNELVPSGKIIDYPSSPFRMFSLDMGRMFYSKQFIINLIKEMSWLKMNVLSLHMSDNEISSQYRSDACGFRIQSFSHPEITVKQNYLSQQDIIDIINVGNQYGVQISPDFDTPGHMATILRVHPEFRLPKATGYESNGLNIVDPDAIAFVKDIYQEMGNLFSLSNVEDELKTFQIGCDEFISMESPVSTWPVIQQYLADTTNPNIQTIQDVYIEYINNIASFVSSLGYTPRIWNDCVYRHLNDGTEEQHLPLNNNIIVDYWTHWDNKMPTIATLRSHGLRLMNFDDAYLYWVLGENAGYTYPTAERIYNDTSSPTNNGWNASIFPSTQDGPQIVDFDTNEYFPSDFMGSSFSIWSDKANTQNEQWIANKIFDLLPMYALRTYRPGSYELINKIPLVDFRQIINKIGQLF